MQAFNSNIKFVLFYIKEYVIKTIKRYKYQIINTPTDFISACGLFVGYSGTISNKSIYPSYNPVFQPKEGEQIQTNVILKLEEGEEIKKKIQV